MRFCCCVGLFLIGASEWKCESPPVLATFLHLPSAISDFYSKFHLPITIRNNLINNLMYVLFSYVRRCFQIHHKADISGRSLERYILLIQTARHFTSTTEVRHWIQFTSLYILCVLFVRYLKIWQVFLENKNDKMKRFIAESPVPPPPNIHMMSSVISDSSELLTCK